jgi:hypothetical protein
VCYPQSPDICVCYPQSWHLCLLTTESRLCVCNPQSPDFVSAIHRVQIFLSKKTICNFMKNTVNIYVSFLYLNSVTLLQHGINIKDMYIWLATSYFPYVHMAGNAILSLSKLNLVGTNFCVLNRQVR